jgi:hypothetical protein
MGMSGYVSVYGYRYVGACGCRQMHVGVGVYMGADMCGECRCEGLGLGQEKPG